MHCTVRLQLEDVAGPHGSEFADAPEVVPDQVHDHGVLGTVLFGGEEASAGFLVLFLPSPTARRSLHGAARDCRSASLEEEFGGRRQDVEPAQIEVGGIGRPLRRAQASVERQGVPCEGGPQADRVVDLVDGAISDGVTDQPDAAMVLRGFDVGRPFAQVEGSVRRHHFKRRRAERRHPLVGLLQGYGPFEDSEPQEREWPALTDPERRVEGRRRFV